MEKFRNLTNNIFFKIFLSFVGISFITFGIGDFIMNSSNSWIAKVDDKKIAYSDFTKTMQNSRERIYRASPNEEVLQYLNSSRFKNDTVNNLVVETLIDEMQQYFGIYPNKELILKDITAHPRFQNPQGGFNRVEFINYLKINGMNEEAFIENASRQAVSQIITNSLIYSPVKNNKLAKEIYKFREEKRKADVISISLKDVKASKTPTKEEQLQYFEKNQAKYTLPEFRKISYMEFNQKDVMPKVTISDAQIVEYYDNSSIYIKPATKDFYHLLFDDEIEAIKFFGEFEDKIKAGASKDEAFLQLALKFKERSGDDILLSGLTNRDLLPEIAQDVFALSLGDHSQILQSALGFHVFYFINENPESKEKLTKQVKSEIKDNLLSERKEELFVAKIEEIDDMLLTTNSLKEVSKKLKVKLRNLEAFNKDGLSKNKRDISNNIKLDDFLKNSFASLSGEASELFYSSSNNKYYAIMVTNVEESRNMEFEEVSKDVVKILKQNNKRIEMLKLANSIYEDLNGKKTTLSNIVNKYNLKVTKNKIFPRSFEVVSGGKNVNYANRFLKDLFDVKVGEVTNPHVVSDQEIHIGIVRKTIAPLINQKKIAKLSQELSTEFKDSILSGYDEYIQGKFPVEVNYKLLNNDNQEL